jgi:hypothetical protein
MDITPHQLNALLREFKKIREHLEELHNDLNEQVTAIRSGQERDEQQRNQLPIPFEIKLEKDQERKREAEGERQHATQRSVRRATWATFVATLLAFGAAAVYAYYAHQTLVEIQKQTPQVEKSAIAAKKAADTAHDTLINSQKAFEMDERPYLVVDSHRPIFALNGFVANQKLSVNVDFKNIGKEPAIRQITAMHLVNYQGPEKKLTQAGYQERLRSFTDNWFDKMRREAKKGSTEIGEYIKGHGEDIAPSDSWFASTNDNYVLSPTEYASIANNTDPEGLLLLFVVVTYSDGFGNSYETDVCQMFWGTHPEIWHRCPAYNTIR